MTHVEVRVTINQPGVSVGQVVLVDPEVPYIAMCLDSGALVRTGREFSIPSPSVRQAVRPDAPTEASAAPDPPEAAPTAVPKRKRASRAKTRPS